MWCVAPESSMYVRHTSWVFGLMAIRAKTHTDTLQGFRHTAGSWSVGFGLGLSAIATSATHDIIRSVRELMSVASFSKGITREQDPAPASGSSLYPLLGFTEQRVPVFALEEFVTAS